MGDVIRYLLMLLRVPLSLVGGAGRALLGLWKRMSKALQGATFVATTAVLGLIADVGGIASMIFGENGSEAYVCAAEIEPHLCTLLIARHDGLLTDEQSNELNDLLIAKALAASKGAPRADREDIAELVEEATAGDSALDDELTTLLAEGKTGAAIDLLEDAAEKTGHSTAEQWRKVGTLALGQDAETALRAWRRVTELAPDDPWGWIYLARAERAAGNLQGAVEAALKARDSAQTDRDQTIAEIEVGDNYILLGEYGEAAGAYQRVLAYREELLRVEPTDLVKFDLATSYERMGLILLELGQDEASKLAYGASLALREDLFQRTPDVLDLNRGIAIIHERLGDFSRKENDFDDALISYLKALTIIDRLLSNSPDDKTLLRDKSVLVSAIGETKLYSRDFDGALNEFNRALAIAEELWAQDRASTELKRDIAVNHAQIGEVLRNQRKFKPALEEYDYALKLSLELTDKDPDNILWQRDVASHFRRIGDIKASMEDMDGAVVAYAAAADTLVALFEKHPPLPDWQYELSIVYERGGDLFRAAKNYDAALEFFGETRIIRHNLSVDYPDTPQWRRDKWFILMKMALTQMEAGNSGEALRFAEEGLTIGEALRAEGYEDPRIELGLTEARREIARFRAALDTEAR